MNRTKQPSTGTELGEELLAAVRQMKAGKAARQTDVEVSRVTRVRLGMGLSQRRFAFVLGVSPRTVQDWEQGRRKPTGAAKTLLRIAELHPRALKDVNRKADVG